MLTVTVLFSLFLTQGDRGRQVQQPLCKSLFFLLTHLLTFIRSFVSLVVLYSLVRSGTSGIQQVLPGSDHYLSFFFDHSFIRLLLHQFAFSLFSLCSFVGIVLFLFSSFILSHFLPFFLFFFSLLLINLLIHRLIGSESILPFCWAMINLIALMNWPIIIATLDS